MEHEAKQLKILALKKRIQTTLESKKIIQMLVGSLTHMGYRRVRYYDLIYDPKFTQVVMVGRYSSGMNDRDGFYGYRISESDKNYLTSLIRTKQAQLIVGREVLFRNPGSQWVKKLGLTNEAFIDVPLVVGDELIGLISVDNRGGDTPLSQADSVLLNDLASFASIAIYNARSREDFSILSEIGSESIRRQLNKDLLKYIVKTICRRLNALGCSVFLYDKDKRKLIRKETYIKGCTEHQLKSLFGEEYESGQNLTGYAYKYRKALNVTDFSHFERKTGIKFNRQNVIKYQNFVRRMTGKKVAIRNAIFAPLIVQNEKIGVVRAVNNLEGRIPFPNSDLNLIELLANLIGLIINNALSFQSINNLSKRVTLLSEVNDRLLQASQAGTEPQRLELIVKYASEIMEAENTALFLVKKKKKKKYLKLMTEYGNPNPDSDGKAELEITSRPGTGLTGHAAHYGRPICLFGDKLISHWAVRDRKSTRPYLWSKKCVSFLSAPLRRNGELIGLLKSENKYRDDGSKRQHIPFSKEDVIVSQIFANKIVLCLDVGERQRFLDSLIQQIAEPFIALDENGKILIFNQMAQDLLDWKAKDVRGKSVVRLYKDKATAKKVMRTLHKSEDNKVHDLNIECRNRSGDLIPISLSATLLLDEIGRRSGSIGVFRDLRKLRKREEESRMAIFAEITRGIAHEITDVLQTIKVDAELIGEVLVRKELDLDAVIDFSKRVLGQAVEGHRILGWMKHLRSSHEIERRRVNLNKALSMVLSQLKDKIDGKQINVRPIINKSIFVPADRFVVMLIFRNLLTNALESMRRRGTVVISARQEKEQVRVSFRDTGRGVSTNMVNRIFQPFSTTKKTTESWGLGLFFCKFLAQMMGGDVYLKETGHHGSTFVVSLNKTKPLTGGKQKK